MVNGAGLQPPGEAAAAMSAWALAMVVASSRCAVERAMPSSPATSQTRAWPESRSSCSMRNALSTDSIA